MLRVYELIKEKGFTQEEFAAKVGVTRSSLIKTLSGNPSIGTLQRMSDALGVDFLDLFNDKREKQTSINCPSCGAEIIIEAKEK
ncbi:MAG: helix-turn-helix transcriptional regulator [Bacteroidia bacterium]|nr:helix-turn-helix transcriptional regulator [Bacteroidia bacterium]